MFNFHKQERKEKNRKKEGKRIYLIINIKYIRMNQNVLNVVEFMMKFMC